MKLFGTSKVGPTSAMVPMETVAGYQNGWGAARLRHARKTKCRTSRQLSAYAKQTTAAAGLPTMEYQLPPAICIATSAAP